MSKPPEYERLDLSQTPLERVKTLLNGLTKDPDYRGWDVNILRTLKLQSVSEGRTEFIWTITEDMCNKSKNLHGGCIATTFDIISSITLMTAAKPGFMDGGSVSRAFSCHFLAAVSAGSTVRMICQVARGGKKMSHVQGELRTLVDDKLVVTFAQDKVEIPRAKM